MTIYLIGPSGVGKSHCARYAATVLKAEHRELDELCAGHQFNWTVCNKALDEIEREARTNQAFHIIDIGAGTQCLPELQQYLESRHQRVVLIYAPPPEVIRRNPMPTRSSEEYEQTEFKTRERLYSTADHIVDVSGNSPDDAKARLAGFIGTSFGVPVRRGQGPGLTVQ